MRIAIALLIIPLIASGTGMAEPEIAQPDRETVAFDRHDIPISTAPAHMTILDANGDSLPDLAITDQKETRLYVLLGDGQGAFQKAENTPVEAGEHPGEIISGDFNRDGHADCAIANHDVPYLTILLGNGEGGFTPSPASPVTVRNDPHPHSIQTADINSDSIADLIIDSPNDHALVLLYGDGEGGFAQADPMVSVGGKPYHTIVAGDVNGDGHPDLITPNPNNISVLVGNGQGTFVHTKGSPFGAADPFSVAIGDVNGDKHADIAAGGGERDASVTVLLGDSTGSFSPAPGSPFRGGRGASTVACGDVNGDGFDDICCTHYHSDNVTILLGGPAAITPAPESPISAGDAPYGIAVSDLNGDGNAEIIVGHYESGFVSILQARQTE